MWIYLILTSVVLAFFCLILRGSALPPEIEGLNSIAESGKKILVKPNGQLAGVVEREEPYYDEEYEMKRRRFVYTDLDGNERKEPRDGVSKKTMKKVDLVPIEFDGGAAVTQLSNPDGELLPIIVGKEAEEKRVSEEDYEALQSRLNKLEREHDQKESRRRELLKRVERLRRQRDNLEDDVSDFADSNEELGRSNERLRARVRGAESKADMLEDEFARLAERYEQVQEDVDDILSRAQERERKAIDMGATPEQAPKEEEAEEEGE